MENNEIINLSKSKTRKRAIQFLLVGGIVFVVYFFLIGNLIDLIFIALFFGFLATLSFFSGIYSKYYFTEKELVLKTIFGEQKTNIKKIRRIIVKKWGSQDLLLEMKNKEYKTIGWLDQEKERELITLLKEKNSDITILQEYTKYGATPEFEG